VRNDGRYRVHEFADLAGVTVKTLHHYDRVGLLRPRRTASGYRVYMQADLVRLEQILALKTIGFSLTDIRSLLDLEALPLPAIFRQQREVLEEKRQLLDRAIRALTDAEGAASSASAPVTTILQDVIKVMNMQDIEAMRKYYNDDAWAQWQHYYDAWPSPAWQALYRDIGAAITSDPTAPLAQALADRWQALTKADAVTPAVRTGMIKAWADREHWPPSLKRRMAEFDIERATRFIADALWVRWADEQDSRRQHGGPGVPRVTDSHRALFDEWASLLDRDPAGGQAQDLLARWETLLDEECDGDEDIKAGHAAFVRRRQSWPAGMRRYIASLYDADTDTWWRVMDFIDQALACKRSGERPSHPDGSSSRQSGADA
jgi:MerR family transcriptional regulator, thiopeptide resistance regulator